MTSTEAKKRLEDLYKRQKHYKNSEIRKILAEIMGEYGRIRDTTEKDTKRKI